MSSIFDWSLTAANNANSDSAINWQEGQLPSSVNNSARQMMTRVAEFLKDFGGTVTAGGSANAITITANSPFSAYATGQVIAFKASATNTGAVTANVNSIGSKAIRKSSPVFDTALAGGEITDDGVYILIYDAALNGAAGGWLLLNPNYVVDPLIKWRSRFVGEVVYANTAVTGTEAPPSTTTDTVWIELSSGLTGSGGFNENKLTSESVSGSGALVLASAVISYSASPMNGQTVRLLNAEQRILRPSASPGTLQTDQFQGFRLGASGGTKLTLGLLQITGGSTPTPFTTGSDYFVPVDDGTNGTPRTGTETRMKNIGVKAYMRIA